jgi:hypothetical protein
MTVIATRHEGFRPRKNEADLPRRPDVVAEVLPLSPICGKLISLGPLSQSAEFHDMEIDKLVTYSAIGIAGLVLLIFLLDLTAAIFGRYIAMDIMFIIGAGFLLWQGIETILELR